MQAEQFRSYTNVSRETFEMYKLFINHLSHWNKKINLVAVSTEGQLWNRHALDSHQLVKHVPTNAKTVLDLGSGAGFPGLVLAIEFRDRPGFQTTMIEANGKKCNFLRAIIRELKLPARVIQDRVENVNPETFNIITARAFAQLPKLFQYSEPFWGEGTIGLFPKGSGWAAELEQAKNDWNFSAKTIESQTDKEARILLVENLVRKHKEVDAGENT